MERFNCISTGIGSLPVKRADEALRIIFDFTDIPFWPQLPKRDFREQMIPQFSEGMPGIRLDLERERIWVELGNERAEELYRFYEAFLEGDPDRFQISSDYSLGLHEFLKGLTRFQIPDSRLQTYKYIKGQVTGPITFSLGLADQNRRPIYYDEELRDVATKLISMKALYQIKRLKGLGKAVIIFLDEPILSAIGSSAYMGVGGDEILKALKEAVDTIHSAGALAGIHCCGKADWSLVLSSGINILSFDAYHFFDSLTLYPAELKGFIENGGSLAWGIVPTGEDIDREDPMSLIERLKDGLRRLSSFGLKEGCLSGPLITPSCGTGAMEVDKARKVFQLLEEVGKAFK